MAVDIRQLTIGSDGRPDAHLRYARACTVDPTPLTTDLLEEIGFEKGNTDIVKRDNGHYICLKSEMTDGEFRWRMTTAPIMAARFAAIFTRRMRFWRCTILN